MITYITYHILNLNQQLHKSYRTARENMGNIQGENRGNIGGEKGAAVLINRSFISDLVTSIHAHIMSSFNNNKYHQKIG